MALNLLVQAQQSGSLGSSAAGTGSGNIPRLILDLFHIDFHHFTTNERTSISGFSKAKKRIDRTISDHGGIKHWTLHDLRRTMVTVMNEHLSVQPHVVEAVVNHSSGTAKAGVAGVYNRAIYFDERKLALQSWVRFVMQSRSSTY